MRDYVCLTNILVTFIKAFCLDYRKEEVCVLSSCTKAFVGSAFALSEFPISMPIHT